VSIPFYPSFSSLTISTERAEISNFVLHERGRVLPKDGFFTLFARDSCKFPMSYGQNPILKVELRHKWREGVVLDLSGSVERNSDASSTVSLNVVDPGRYAVLIREETSQHPWIYLGDITIEA
jgi:hypothetical protein